MIRLRDLNAADVLEIRAWPPYPGDMAQMDYALREGGWLGHYRRQGDVVCYAAVDGEALVGFSLLASTGEGEAEFRIALRPDRTGAGLGEVIVRLTLQKGFEELGLSRIHLTCRKNNFRGLRLYPRLGFRPQGELRKEIQGVLTDLWTMDITREQYRELESV